MMDKTPNALAGTITTVAGDGKKHGATPDDLGDGGPAAQAHFFYPDRVAWDAKGNLYIADSGHHRVRMVTATDKKITTVAGDGTTDGATPDDLGDGGPATQAHLSWPDQVAWDAKGNLYIADTEHHRVRMVTATDKKITTVAGDGKEHGPKGEDDLGDGGPATQAHLAWPKGVACDAKGNLYITDTDHHRVRMVTATDKTITTVAGDGKKHGPKGEDDLGDGGPATQAHLSWPDQVACDAKGNLYISDTFHHRVRMVAGGCGL
jgi:trimeric autotransporter adhesin